MALLSETDDALRLADATAFVNVTVGATPTSAGKPDAGVALATVSGATRIETWIVMAAPAPASP